MKRFLSALALITVSTAAGAAPVNPDFFFTANDQGNNGYGVPAVSTPSHPVVQTSDFSQNFVTATRLLRGSAGAGTADRKSYAFLYFGLDGISSVSNATLSFQNQFDFFLNTSGFPPATPTIGIKSLAMSSTTSVPLVSAAILAPGAASTTFETQAPQGTAYNLDVTGLINAALTTRTAGQKIALILENTEDFDSLPDDVPNGGYGNINFTGFSLDPTEGPAPAVAAPGVVPLPAGLPLLLGGLAAMGLIRRKRG